MSDSAAQSYEYAVLHPETGNEVARYDTPAEAHDAIKWYGKTYGKSLDVMRVKAGSREVCLGVADDA